MWAGPGAGQGACRVVNDFNRLSDTAPHATERHFCSVLHMIEWLALSSRTLHRWFLDDLLQMRWFATWLSTRA